MVLKHMPQLDRTEEHSNEGWKAEEVFNKIWENHGTNSWRKLETEGKDKRWGIMDILMQTRKRSRISPESREVRSAKNCKVRWEFKDMRMWKRFATDSPIPQLRKSWPFQIRLQ